ncbi:MAG: ATP-binding protein [Anaerolineae bacterium]|nr:ATP-binding protein [Anaerolineae bacterium]
MKQLVVLSGKGGTGKTSVAAAFAHLAVQLNVVLADADVDAANLELVLAPEVQETHEFMGGQVAVIDAARCLMCGTCFEVCRFDAVFEGEASYHVDPIACDGCAACVTQCPEEAIHMEPQRAGRWMRSQSRYGPLVHAALLPAQENSGKLVTMVKQQARLLALDRGADLVLVDGPPGIGCPVISAASGADLVVAVAEPTVSGIHDLERLQKTTDHFNLPVLVCINKADVYPEGAAAIEAYCRERGLALAGRIPFDAAVVEAMTQGEPVTAYRPASPAAAALRAVWEQVLVALDLRGESR